MAMTTGKRQIPINGPGRDGLQAAGSGPRRGGVPGEGAGVGGAVSSDASQAAEGRAASRTKTAATPSKAAPRGSGGAQEVPVSEVQKLRAERDALAAERDALAAERDALLAERDALAAQVEALTDSRLRLQADFENFRKRALREAMESRVRTQCELLDEFLPVLDNLERALEAAEHHEEGKVLTGVRMTRDMFASLLKRAGVEEIEGVGVRFDPTVHEAVAVQPSDQEEGTVLEVLQRGYRHGAHVLRPARVVVSSGPADSGAVVEGAPPTEGLGGSNGGAVSG